MHRLAIALLSSSLLVLAGCKSPCRELSEKLCDCLTNPVERDRCVRDATSEESRLEPTSEQEAVCEEKLGTCRCENLDTQEGKRDCGLAY